MLNCRDIGPLLHDYLEGALEPPVSQQLDAHLADCPGCVASVNTYRHTVDLSKELRCEDIPPELQRKLRSFIKLQGRQRGLWSRLRSLFTKSS